MSLDSDCPPCMERDHSRHDARHGVRPGLIGGTICACKGECETRPPVDLLERLQRSVDAARRSGGTR